MKRIRLILSDKDFNNLVQGKEVTKKEGFTEVKMILSDIGFHNMQKAVNKAIDLSLNSGKIRYNPEDDI